MDLKGKFRPNPAKRFPGFFRSIHRLPTTFVKDCGFIPIVLINTAAVVEKHIKTKEIFQTQGRPNKAYATLNQLSKGRLCRINPSLTVHDAVEAMKLVLVSLPEALIPENVCDSLITASRENSADQYGNILAKFRMKSPLNFGILHFMMILLRKVSMHTQQNLMDVRKLATIFVLDVIKPLKLDDPNDGEFLSERMQRLPYLIMVVEKLILNVDIFKSARSKKPETNPVTGLFSNSRYTATIRGAGSGDSGIRFQNQVDYNHSKPAAHASRDVSSTSYDQPFHTTRSSGRGISKSPFSTMSPVSFQKARNFPPKPLPSAAQSFHHSVFRGESVVFQNPRGTCVPSNATPTTNIHGKESLTSAEKNFTSCSSPLPPPRGCLFKLGPKLSQPSRYPRFGSRSSSTTTLQYRTIGRATCTQNQPVVDNEAAFPKKKFLESMFQAKTISKNMSLNRDLKNDYESKAKEAPKEWRPGRKTRAKAGSLPPSVQPRPAVTCKRSRALSCTASGDRSGSSPKKKRMPVRGKVGSFREGDRRFLKLEKRRSGSVEALNNSGSHSGYGNSAVWWSGGCKRTQSVGRKRPREQNLLAASPIICFSRGSDRITFTADEIICPWYDNETTSDDSSLMTRTIRNPRILAVPPSLPVSPVTTELSTKTSRRGRCRVRNSGHPLSITSQYSSHSCHSLCLPSNLTSFPSGHQQTVSFRVIDPTLPSTSDTTSVGGSTLPSAKSDSRPGSLTARNSSEMAHTSAKRNASISPRIISSKSDTRIQGGDSRIEGREKPDNNERTCSLKSDKGEERMLCESQRSESIHSQHKCDRTSGADGEKGLASQATCDDVISFSCFDGHAQSGGGAEKTSSTNSSNDNPRLLDLSPLQKSSKFTRSPQEPQQRQSSQEFESLSSSLLESNVSNQLVRHKTSQRPQPPHYRRVSLQQLCQVRQPSLVRKQQRRKRSYKRRQCYYACCLLIFTLLLSSVSLYLLLGMEAAS